MQRANSPGLTTLLEDVHDQIPGATERLIRTVYPALRQIAASLFRGERDWHTLQPTAVVHEVFLRLFPDGQRDWKDSAHFFLAVTREMRHVLVAHARSRLALKRGGNLERIPAENFDRSGASESQILEGIAVDELLHLLETEDVRAANVVELRFFSGLTLDEIAAVLKVSPATVRDDWRFARTWLKARMEGN